MEIRKEWRASKKEEAQRKAALGRTHGDPITTTPSEAQPAVAGSP